ncbi:MAG: FAD-dependent oxidoreductase [Pseudomonadales bacterium]
MGAEQEHYVIIGGSHAGAQLAFGLRKAGFEGQVSIVGDEPYPPYHRPPLSKACLADGKSISDLYIRAPDLYTRNEIDLVLGSRVTAIDRSEQIITLHDGGSIPYTKLALATGAKVRRISLPGVDLAGVCYLRDIGDVDRIKCFVGAGKSAVIIGGGYIGLETAASLRKLEMQVTVLEALPRVLQRVTAPEISAFYTRVHREEGVEIITDAAVESIQGSDAVSSVTCADGKVIPADLVIIGVGVIPETELAEAAGLEVDNGIVVDEYARTSDHAIVAAGDCTQHYNPIYAQCVRLESVQNATDQATTAANTMCGKLEPYAALPWFWSDQYDLKLQIAGFSQGFDQVVIRGNIESGRSFSAFYYRAGHLLAVDAINSPKDFMAAKRALAQKKTVAPERASDLSIDIRELFT